MKRLILFSIAIFFVLCISSQARYRHHREIPIPEKIEENPIVASSLPLLVPSYFEPEGYPNPWHTMCNSMPIDSIAIANPENGPTNYKINSYAEAINYCQLKNQKVIGYVYSEYGRRNITEIKNQINDYYSWYPSINGIFLDEMAENPDETYYKTLENYIHERNGIVVGNPGDMASTGWQLKVVDKVVTFEGTEYQYNSYKPDSWVMSANKNQIVNIIFNSFGIQDCSKAQNNNAGSVFVTNLGEPNPYGKLPSFWSSETASC